MDFTLLLILLTLLSGILFLISKVTTTYLQNNPIVDFISSLFPILAFVLIFRSFVIEPYRIPSGSMIPNLLVGDFILVKKIRKSGFLEIDKYLSKYLEERKNFKREYYFSKDLSNFKDFSNKIIDRLGFDEFEKYT